MDAYFLKIKPVCLLSSSLFPLQPIARQEIQLHINTIPCTPFYWLVRPCSSTSLPGLGESEIYPHAQYRIAAGAGKHTTISATKVMTQVFVKHTCQVLPTLQISFRDSEIHSTFVHLCFCSLNLSLLLTFFLASYCWLYNEIAKSDSHSSLKSIGKLDFV